MVVVKRILVVVVGDVGGLARALRQDLVVAGLVLLDGKDLSLVPLFDIWVNGDDLRDGLLLRVFFFLAFLFGFFYISVHAPRFFLVGLCLFLLDQSLLAHVIVVRLRLNALGVEVTPAQPWVIAWFFTHQIIVTYKL